MNLQELGITKEQILEIAAKKIADEYAGEEFNDIGARVERIIQQRVKEAFDKGLSVRIDAFLTTEMERLVNQKISPVDIWGEKAGEPTTIRDQLAIRAQKFWEVKVNKDGREEHYGGTPRWELFLKQILQDKFTEAIKNNTEAIVAGFKQALKTDAIALVSKQIDNLIKTNP